MRLGIFFKTESNMLLNKFLLNGLFLASLGGIASPVLGMQMEDEGQISTCVRENSKWEHIKLKPNTLVVELQLTNKQILMCCNLDKFRNRLWDIFCF